MVALVGCATLDVAEERRQALEQAISATQRADHAFAARAAFTYVNGGTQDDDDFDRALLLLGRSLERAGLSYAAGLYFGDVAREKRDPEAVPDALRGIERVALGGAYDHEALIRGFLAAAELPRLPADIQGFVDYHKGLDAMRRGEHDWAERHVLAERWVARTELERAAEAFQAMVDDPRVPDRIRRDALRSLARLHLSAGRYAEAEAIYEPLRVEAPRDGSLLLELAWTHYHLGRPRRALGLLLALDAPVHRHLIAPERFLLEAMCLRRLCQFQPAQLAARRLSERYRAELAELYDGIPPARSDALRRTARTRGEAAAEAALVDRLEAERRRLSELESDLGDALYARLRLYYSRGLQEARRREQRLVGKEAAILADELLQAEDGVRLILHELGVAILRGHGRHAGQVNEPPLADAGPGTVRWRFRGEFWTDEIDDLVIQVEDRCILD